MATTINTTATTASNAGITNKTLADLKQGRIVIRNENRELLAELFGEALALPNPPLNILLPNGQPVVSGWNPSLSTLSTFFLPYAVGSLGDTPEARTEARKLAVQTILAYIPYAIAVHATLENNDIINIVCNFKSTLTSVRETMAHNVRSIDMSEALKVINLDSIKFYDFDRRGHWIGSQFIPSTPQVTATLTMAD